MEHKGSKFWEERLKNFEEKSLKIKEKARELENEISNIENSLYHRNIARYRASLVGRVRKTFIKAFSDRDELPPEPAVKEEWEALTKLLAACTSVLKALDTEEASVCSGVPELKQHLKDAIKASVDEPGQDIFKLLEE